MPHPIRRDAGTGKFTTKKDVQRRPGQTTTESTPKHKPKKK